MKANTHFSTTTFEAFALRACQDIPQPHILTQRSQRPNIPGSHPPYPSGRLQYQSSFYKPKTYKDMEEKTLFKLARVITGTDNVSSKGGTVTYRITSLKRKLVNGKVASTSTPSCTLGSTPVSWATWGGVTVGDGYLDVKINYSENTGSSRSTPLIFNQVESDNKINLTVTQGSGVTYTGYIKMVSNSLPLGNNKDDTALILVMAYLNGSDGSKKPETPHVGNAPDWCSVSVAPMGTPENHYMLSLTALSSNQTGANRSGHIFLTCGDANLSLPVTQITAKKIINNLTINVFKSPTSNTSARCDIRSDQLVASNITFRLQLQYGVSSGDVKEYIYTLAKGSAILRNTFAIQNGANPRIVDYGYSPQEDSKYIYSVTISYD